MIKKQSNCGNVRSSLNIFDDKDGLLRLKGRFPNSKLRYKQQYPGLPQSDSYFTNLIIWDTHEATMHHGNFSSDPIEILDYKGKKECKECLAKVCGVQTVSG